METEFIHLLAYRNNQLEAHLFPSLDGPNTLCTVKLRKLPGARWVRVVLQTGKATLFRAEVKADEGMPWITLVVQRRHGDKFDLSCREGAPIRRLHDKSTHSGYETAIDWIDTPQEIDLAVVIDATTRIFPRHQEASISQFPTLLLAKPNRESWEAHVDKLCGFVETLHRSCTNCRIAVLAFGDQAMPDNVTAFDLQPDYMLYPKPEYRALQAMKPETLKDRLLAIPPSSGGDFIDALADALAVCDGLLWRQVPGVRKLVLISGESPGYSILHPLRKSDACVREHDVDTQALRLNRKSVALLSLYHGPPEEYLKDLVGAEKRDLREAAREQYARLATLPDLAFDAARFEGAKEAEFILNWSGLLGYGGCCGEWIE